jgi:hypothetical protein
LTIVLPKGQSKWMYFLTIILSKWVFFWTIT